LRRRRAELYDDDGRSRRGRPSPAPWPTWRARMAIRRRQGQARAAGSPASSVPISLSAPPSSLRTAGVHEHEQSRPTFFSRTAPRKGARPLGATTAGCGGIGGGWRSPLDLEEAGGRRCFPGLLQETAAVAVPSNADNKRDGAILKETGAGGLSGASSSVQGS
jgi:hypothetical protein